MPVSCVRMQKGSRARNAYHHVTVPLGPLQPLHRLLLRRSRILLGLHRFLQLLPGGSNEVGSAALSGAGAALCGGARCGCLIALFHFLWESRAVPTGLPFTEATEPNKSVAKFLFPQLNEDFIILQRRS